jgi:hypothetical protein
MLQSIPIHMRSAQQVPCATSRRAAMHRLAAGNMGAMLSSVYATNIAGLRILGMQGWRFAFISVAAVSAVTGVAMWLLARDPRCARSSWQLHPHFQQHSSSLRYSSSSSTTTSNSWRSDKRRGVGKILRGLYSSGSSSSDSAGNSSSSGWRGVVAAVRAALRSPLAAEVWVVLSTPSFIVVVVQVSSDLLFQRICSMPHVCARHPSPVLAPHASCCRIEGHHA